MVGLVSPDMIDTIHNLGKLNEALAKRKATHIATLRNWFEIVNQNPIFRTSELKPEVMEVFVYNPGRTHFTSQIAGPMTAKAGYLLSKGRVREAGKMLERSLSIDPQSSRTHLFIGLAFMRVNRLDKAEVAFRTALKLHPTYWDAHVAMAEVAKKLSKPREAIFHLERVIEHNPSYAEGYRLLAEIYQRFSIDILKAEKYLKRYSELSNNIQKRKKTINP